MKIGNMVCCKKIIYFSDDTFHVPGIIYHVNKDNVAYFRVNEANYVIVKPITKTFNELMQYTNEEIAELGYNPYSLNEGLATHDTVVDIEPSPIRCKILGINYQEYIYSNG